jgi:hypothetical protein
MWGVDFLPVDTSRVDSIEAAAPALTQEGFRLPLSKLVGAFIIRAHIPDLYRGYVPLGSLLPGGGEALVCAAAACMVCVVVVGQDHSQVVGGALFGAAVHLVDACVGAVVMLVGFVPRAKRDSGTVIEGDRVHAPVTAAVCAALRMRAVDTG